LVLFGFRGCPSRELVGRDEGEVADVEGAMDLPRLRHLHLIGNIGDLLRNFEGSDSAASEFGGGPLAVTGKVEVMSVEHHLGSHHKARIDRHTGESVVVRR